MEEIGVVTFLKGTLVYFDGMRCLLKEDMNVTFKMSVEHNQLLQGLKSGELRGDELKSVNENPTPLKEMLEELKDINKNLTLLYNQQIGLTFL